jgi:hypothetical protein
MLMVSCVCVNHEITNMGAIIFYQIGLTDRSGSISNRRQAHCLLQSADKFRLGLHDNIAAPKQRADLAARINPAIAAIPATESSSIDRNYRTHNH